MRSQCDLVLEMLKRGEQVTPATVHERTGSYAAHSRISELREQGYDIGCTIKRNGRSKWGEYFLIKTDLFA